MLRLTLLAHAPTAATGAPAFPADEPAEVEGLQAGRFARATRALTAPERRTRDTALAFGLDAMPDEVLRDLDHGTWAGRPLASVEPEALGAWMADPDAAPHGGEAVAALVRRVAAWLEDQREGRGRLVAVTHPAVLRAAVIAVLGAPPQAFWRIDAAPLSTLDLTHDGRRWALRGLAQEPLSRMGDGQG